MALKLPEVHSDEPFDLTQYIAASSILLAVSCVVSYILLPHAMPTDQRKPGLFEFATGIRGLKYVRGKGEPQFTMLDFPQSAGTASHGLDVCCATFDAIWNPAKESDLRSGVLRFMLPWYIYTHIFFGALKILSLFVGAQLFTFTTRFTTSGSSDYGEMFQLQAVGFTFAMALHLVPTWTGGILALRATDCLSIALKRLVIRKVHRLNMEGAGRTGTAQAQQIAGECGMLTSTLWVTELRSAGADILLAVFALYQLSRTLGLTCVFVNMVVLTVCGVVAAISEGKKSECEQRIYGHASRRQVVMQSLLDNFRALRALGWVERVTQPLEEERLAIRRERMNMMFWGGMSTTISNSMMSLINFLCLIFINFVNGQQVSYAQAALDTASIGVVMGSFQASAAALRGWYAITMNCAHIEQFLRLPEGGFSSVADGDIQASGASFAWPDLAAAGQSKEPVLCEVTLVPMKKGELVIVSGAVGAGKSSLLLALLGELPLLQGSFSRPSGRAVHQPQSPSLLDGSIRDNVVFGDESGEVDEKRLDNALEVAQLGAELRDERSTLHKKGAGTAVGRRGGHLSGGQRARVALARSVYAVLGGVGLVFLDDPIASVDNEVAQGAWEAAVVGAMRSATRIVAVNAQMLERVAPSADRLVLLGPGGKIVFDGPPAEGLRQQQKIIADAVAADGAGNSAEADGAPTKAEESKSLPAPPADEDADNGDAADGKGDESPKSPKVAGGAPEAIKQAAAVGMLPSDLSKPLAAAWAFTCRTRFRLFAVGTLGMLGTMSFPLAFQVILDWEVKHKAGDHSHDTEYLLKFGATTLGFTILAACRNALDNYTQTNLFMQLVTEIDEAVRSLGMPYFWRGRRRAERRIRKLIDMPVDAMSVLAWVPMYGTRCVVAVLILSYYVPTFWLILGIALYGYLKMTELADFKATQLETSATENHNTLLAKVSEQFDNMISIRALGRCSSFETSLHPIVMCSMYASMMRVYLAAMDAYLQHVIGCLFNTGSTFIVFRMRGLGYSTEQTMAFYHFAAACSTFTREVCGQTMNFRTQLENLNEIERVVGSEFMERPGGTAPKEGWPASGALEFKAVTFAYGPGAQPALREVTLSIAPGENFGVIGKTGSGKSTLVTVLLRLASFDQCCSGRILLDGVDIAGVPLKDLRMAVAVVPQEATLIAGSLKANVGEEFTDAEVLTALEWCGLDARGLVGAPSTSLAGALKKPLVPAALSSGQAQLLMAARAFAKRPKVLILDECTAFLDHDSADRLQEVLSSHARDVTTVSIAHRLRFVRNCDRILTLSLGNTISVETPAKLLEDEQSYFAVNLRLEQMEDGAATN